MENAIKIMDDGDTTMSHQPRRFRVRPREEPRSGGQDVSSWNLFARLDPSVASALFKDAQLSSTSFRPPFDEDHRGWTVAKSNEGFLPLEISFALGERAYVSYNGGDVHIMEVDDQNEGHIDDRHPDGNKTATNGDLIPLIELPSSVLSNDCRQGEQPIVLVRPLAFVQDVATIHLEPLSVSDWELLESDAQFLEEGGLLQQVSLVYSNQILPLQVKGRDMVHVKVLPPADHSKDLPCWRLMANTEVIVNPPLQLNSAFCRFETHQLRVYPTRLDYSDAMQRLAEQCSVDLVSLGTGRGCVHPKTLRLLQGYRDNELSGEIGETYGDEEEVFAHIELIEPKSGRATTTTNCQVVRLVPSENRIPPDHIGFHPLVGFALNAHPLLSNVKVRLLSSPESELGSTAIMENLIRGHVLLKMEPIRMLCNEKAKMWRVPSSTNNLQRHDLLMASCDLIWLAESSRFELSSDAPDDTPISSGSLLRVSTMTGSPVLFCLTFVPRSDSESDIPLKPDASFLRIRDLVGRLNHDMEVVKAMRVLQDREINGLARAIRQFDDVNMLPPTWYCPLLDKVDTSAAMICHTVVNGPAGSGRSHLTLMMAAIARLCEGCSTHYLDCKSLKLSPDIKMKDLLNELTQVFQEAIVSTPSVVILDNLDEVAPKLVTDDSGFESAPAQNYHQINPASVDQAKLVADHLGQLVREACIQHGSGSVAVVITCCDMQRLIPAIVTLLPWDVVTTPLKLSPDDRRAIFSSMLRNERTIFESLNVSHVLSTSNFDSMTEGFRPIDLETVAVRINQMLRAKYESGIGLDLSLDLCLTEVLSSYVPIARQSVVEDEAAAAAKLLWSEVGGLFHVKDNLTESILHPVKYKRIYERSPIKLPRGMLLFGPPGCGKSILVPALAKECGFRLITCRGPELLDKYIGASEAKVRELFARAKAASPCILFLDEFDALAPRRGSDNTGVTDRVVNQLLTFLDGVEDALDDMMYIVAATSRPDKVDPALLRPGRLEKHFYVGLPENEVEWIDLLTRTASKWSFDEQASQAIALGDFQSLIGTSNSDWSHVMQLSGADMKAVLDTAYIGAVHDCLKQGGGEALISIRLEHLQDAFQKTRPSLSAADQKMFMDVYRPFLQDRAGNSNHSQPSERLLKTTLR